MTCILNCIVIHKTRRHCDSRKELTVQQTEQLNENLWHAGRTTKQVSNLCHLHVEIQVVQWYRSQYKTHVSILQNLYKTIAARSRCSITLNIYNRTFGKKTDVQESWPIRDRIKYHVLYFDIISHNEPRKYFWIAKLAIFKGNLYCHQR